MDARDLLGDVLLDLDVAPVRGHDRHEGVCIRPGSVEISTRPSASIISAVLNS